MPLTIFQKKQRKKIIIFVHGLSGNKETWIKNNQKKSLTYWLMQEKIIQDHFDLAYYEYTSHLLKLSSKANFLINVVLKNRFPHKRNLDINQIAKVLETEIKNKAQNYEEIILLGHSMGGLICKNYILNHKNNPSFKVGLFLSLAVPHKGSDFALLGKFILKNNLQIENLKSLSPAITKLNVRWLEQENLPNTTYFVGLNDTIVPKESAVASEKRPDLEFFEKDHFNIIVPSNKDDSVLRVLMNRLEKFIYQEKDNLPPQKEKKQISPLKFNQINIDKNQGNIVVESENTRNKENEIEAEGVNDTKLKQDFGNRQNKKIKKKNKISLKNSAGNDICQDVNNQ